MLKCQPPGCRLSKPRSGSPDQPQPQPPVGRKPLDLLVIEAAQGELLEVVLALHLPGRLPGRLHRRQQQARSECR